MNNKYKLILTSVTAFTIHSADDEYRSSNKGLYKDLSVANLKAPKSGWYGGDGVVRPMDDIWEDEEGNPYRVTPLVYTDVLMNKEAQLKASIKSKLNEEELKFLKLK